MARALAPCFPDLDEHQIWGKVRDYIRTTEEYKAPKLNYNGKKVFNYAFPDTIRLYMFNDAHIGAWGFDEDGYRAYIQRVADDPNGYAIFNGDILNNATLGSKSCVFSQKITPQQQKEIAIEWHWPIRDKTLFLDAGNHEERTYKQTGNDIMYDVCMGLGILDRYNPVCGYLELAVGEQMYHVYVTHNLGRAETKLKSMAKSFSDMDLLLGAHIHTPKVLTVTQNSFGGVKRDTKVVVGASWLVDENYAVAAAYEPVSNAQPTITLRADRHEVAVYS